MKIEYDKEVDAVYIRIPRQGISTHERNKEAYQPGH